MVRPARVIVWVLLSAVLLIGCATAIGKLLGLAENPDGSTGIDRAITSWFVARRASWLTTAARSLSFVGSQRFLIPIVALAVVVLVVRARLALACFLVAGWGGALAIYSVIKPLVDRPRPPRQIWLTDVPGSAFPSGHATQSLATFAALAIVLGVLVPRMRGPGLALAAALALAIGLSRIYLGVHWATDVCAGWLIGAAWVTLVTRCPAGWDVVLRGERSRAAPDGMNLASDRG
ncbi:MAG TPA: phosphatase PAP2 family protein [Solirubrobacteraceae bacterium]